MTDGWQSIRLTENEPRENKPGQRWELSPELGIDVFNLNIAILEPSERLSQNHFHYHENQEELIHVAAGRCCVEVANDCFDAEPGDTVKFDASDDGVHLIHNPFEESCRLVAIGWPPDGRYPIKEVKTHEELLTERA